MTLRRILLACLALLVPLAPVASRTTHRIGAAGFAVDAPAGWRLHGPAGDRLLLLSPGPGAEGVVIARHQAMILVAPLDGWTPGGDLSRLILARTGDDRVLARRTLAGGGDCRTLDEVDTAGEVGPGTEQRSVSLYCLAGDRALVIQLTHWPREPMAARFRSAALRIARSLRLSARPNAPSPR